MRYGVLGGTFDPPHNGHLGIAREALGQLALERVIFAPARLPPHKQGNDVTPIEARLDMLKLAIADTPEFSLSRVDVDRPPPTFTVDAIRVLRQDWGPAAEVYFIMGLDSLANILTWHAPDELIQVCKLAVMNRPDFRVDLDALERQLPGLDGRMVLLKSPSFRVAASDIQRRVSEGRSIDRLVPASVAAYISEHHLYQRAASFGTL